MKVVEIFRSIEGEGIRAGYPAIFVRLYGCNLHCTYCDSRYACDDNDFVEMSVDDILGEVVKYVPCKRITLTGGEPLLDREQAYTLIWALVMRGYEVNIETNGSLPLYMERIPNCFYTMDFKSLSSGMIQHMYLPNMKNLIELSSSYLPNVLKFVVGSQADLDGMHTQLSCLRGLGCRLDLISIYVSPVFGKISPQSIVEYLMEHNIEDVRIQLQLHKYIWDPNKRGV